MPKVTRAVLLCDQTSLLTVVVSVAVIEKCQNPCYISK